MTIPALGELKPYPALPKWLCSEPIEIPFLEGMQMPIILTDLKDSDQDEIIEAVNAFLKLSSSDRAQAAEHVFNNYKDMKDYVDESDLGCEINSAREVWPHVHPKQIYISRRRYRGKEIYVQIAAECDWEQEHGLQIVYRKGGVLSRVSAQDGHLSYVDAYAVSEDQDRIS